MVNSFVKHISNTTVLPRAHGYIDDWKYNFSDPPPVNKQFLAYEQSHIAVVR